MTDTLSDTTKTILFASDIFGISDAFLTLLEDVDVVSNVIKISPYPQLQTHFKNEQQAYQCFQKHGGIDEYVLSLTDILKDHVHIKHVVGFSAGGAALYKVMSNLAASNIQLTLFYPGQIRHFMDKHPRAPCHIIFPESEPHFSLANVIKVLNQQSQLKVEQNSYQHGFMNKNSRSFNQTAYHHYCQMLKELLQKM